MNGLIKEFKDATQQAWLNQPLDITTMLSFNQESGRNFIVVTYLNGFLDSNTILLYDYYMLAKEEACDFQTLKRLIANTFRDIGMAFKTDYHMFDSHTLMLRASCEAYQMDSFDKLYELTKNVQFYLVRLFYWADLCMPWKEMCEAYNKTRE